MFLCLWFICPRISKKLQQEITWVFSFLQDHLSFFGAFFLELSCNRIQARPWAVCLLPSSIWYHNLNNVTLPTPKPLHSLVPLCDLFNLSGEEELLVRGRLLLWEIWTESMCHPSLISTFIISPVQNVFHVKCLRNMHEIGKWLKCHFTVISKPHFLLHSVMLCRYQDNCHFAQCREKGLVCLF